MNVALKKSYICLQTVVGSGILQKNHYPFIMYDTTQQKLKLYANHPFYDKNITTTPCITILGFPPMQSF